MMKNKITHLFLLVFSVSLLTSCFEDQDDDINPASVDDIKDFIYRGLDIFYLYKGDIPILAEDISEEAVTQFKNNYSTPEAFFETLLSPDDRFSVIYSDYRQLENSLAGISKTTGMKTGFAQLSNGDIFGYVRYVLPNTSAESNGVERGMIFNQVDGQQITLDNFQSILGPDTFTISLATIEDNQISPLEETITLTKQEYTENPVHIVNTIELENNQKVGYLMYNAFNRNFDNDLNNAFSQFQAENITDLVVDLRYNGGGSIETSNDLASMITGQFDGQLFSTQVYNELFEDQERLFNNEISTGAGINSLNLNKVYVLTTQSTASASELLIASLRPYIEVVQVGTATTGKYQGSVTLYDSPDFSRSGANINHRYAMQPLILKSVNANGFTDYDDGLIPTIQAEEDFANLGELGNPNETLFAAALNDVSFGRMAPPQSSFTEVELIGESDMNQPNFQRMYVETVE